MSHGKIFGLIVLVIAGLYTWVGYNDLVNKDEAVNKAWGQVEVVYQRRADLIPNLVSTVQGYAAHEKAVFTQVTEARAKVGSLNVNASTMDPALQVQFLKAQGELSSALSRLIAVAENYPSLKASENFRDLQSQLEGTENRIAVERGRYQRAIEALNATVRGFPRNVIAGIFGFERREYYKADEGAAKAPQVKFN